MTGQSQIVTPEMRATCLSMVDEIVELVTVRNLLRDEVAHLKHEVRFLQRRENGLVAILQHRALPLLEKHVVDDRENHYTRVCNLIRAACGVALPIVGAPALVIVTEENNEHEAAR